jgi:hypothetical protein
MLSLFSFYYRIGHNADIRWFAWTLHIALFINLGTFVPSFFIAIFQCR